jgi:RimJ/RimL family protein N-acetyltransferase
MTLPFAIPVLETDRLTLREPREGDLPALTAFAASERTRFIGGPQDALAAWHGFLRQIGHWAYRGYGWWMIVMRSTGQTVGRCGVGFHPGYAEPELGWQVFDGFEGQGIAFEAALAARRHSQTALGLGPLISMVHPDNHRSSRLAERLGARFERMGEIEGVACQIWRHPAGAA